jgi:nucleoside-diphosphate-sugar epimerase
MMTDNAGEMQECNGAGRALVLGADGYLGWPLCLRLVARGYDVYGFDAGLRRRWVSEVGGRSATPIADYMQREALLQQRTVRDGQRVEFMWGHVDNSEELRACLEAARPDVIFHLAEQPSAAYSMRSAHTAVESQVRNIAGTMYLLWLMRELCPDAHLVKLGTMGEWGTPGVDIPEGGFFDIEYRGRVATLPFPKQAGSFYHLSKVFDTENIQAAARWGWGLTFTDIMQGPVYGIRTEEMPGRDCADKGLLTRLDYDECFGTVINRFVLQALSGQDLTVYGQGGQTRGYLALEDSIAAMLLLAEDPPDAGSCRIVNQFVDFWSVLDLAKAVCRAAVSMGIIVEIQHLENPRREAEQHYYQADREILPALGWEGTALPEGIAQFLQDARPFADGIDPAVFAPTTRWQK